MEGLGINFHVIYFFFSILIGAAVSRDHRFAFDFMKNYDICSWSNNKEICMCSKFKYNIEREKKAHNYCFTNQQKLWLFTW